MSRALRLILVAAAMTAFLAGMVIDHAIRRSSGTEVILDLEPVDPRDLLAGYYVIVSTPLHRLDPAENDGDDAFSRGDDIYVSIDQDIDGNWQVTGLHHGRPESGTFIHGKVQYASTDLISAHYNLERFYADEATARALETRIRGDSDRLRLIISVGSDGRALIRGIEIDGERQIVPLF